MFFIVGDSVHGTSIPAGEHECHGCGVRAPFTRVVETRYFCLFGIRLLSIERVADYFECGLCRASVAALGQVPTRNIATTLVVAYLLVGFGQHGQRELAREVCRRIGRFDLGDDELSAVIREVDVSEMDVLGRLGKLSRTMNATARQQVIEAAFVLTHALCEIQYEDRLRINLMGNAMGVSLEFVAECIKVARDNNYYGVRRLLPTGSVS